MSAATPGDLDLRPVPSPPLSPSQPAHHAPASANSTAPSHPPQDQDQEQQPASLANSTADVSVSSTPALPRLEQSQSLPVPPFSAPVSTASSPRPASPSVATGASFHFGQLVSRSLSAPRVRRPPPAQDRLNGILETARLRAQTTSAPHNTLARHAAFRMEPLLRNQSAPGPFPVGSDGDDGPHSRDGRASPRSQRSQGSQRSARHLHYAANAGPYGTLGASVSRSSSGRPRSRKSAAADRGYQQEPPAGAALASASASGAASAAGTATAPPAELPWWKDFLSGFQSIELENKGSVARDHLALERTFLAWLRTSLAFASIGIAVTQLFRLNTAASGGDRDTEEELGRLRHIGRPLGSTFLGISVLILFLGYHRFYQSQQWILKGKFPASRGTILLVSLMAFALMVASLVIVAVVQPSAT